MGECIRHCGSRVGRRQDGWHESADDEQDRIRDQNLGEDCSSLSCGDQLYTRLTSKVD